MNSADPNRWPSLVVMGVAGCGKSSLGAALAQALDRPLIEGDDFHPPANVAKMRAGTPLTDADRSGWLDALGAALQAHAPAPRGDGRQAVLTCSALKAAYRQRLRAAVPGLAFVHLVLTPDEAKARVAHRGAHYFGPALVDSQFDALEPPAGEPRVLSLPATAPLTTLCETVQQWLATGLDDTASAAARPADGHAEELSR
ncbi:gluconokinase [Pseudaquabacterium rugosum]|uniref:Gluconokinase n=1 Tax=Pseudaquabacterium rugosum TaxID=2984194 RepID=A0ABU9BH14_9BURK